MAEWVKKLALAVRNPSSLREFISRIGRASQTAGSGLLDLCLPRSCAGCEKIDPSSPGFWCAECLLQLPHITSPICPQCGRPFPDAPDSCDHLCGECSRGAFRFDLARSAVLHSGIVRDRIHQFKFGGRLEWVPPLVELLETALGSGVPKPQLVLPVPLHVKRLRERGFNQSGLLARELGSRHRLPVAYDLLVRKDRTEPQTHLDRAARLKNVKGAFDVADKSRVRGLCILLVDDVFTTGTTLSECARTLKKHGSAEVYALTVTRALPA